MVIQSRARKLPSNCFAIFVFSFFVSFVDGKLSSDTYFHIFVYIVSFDLINFSFPAVCRIVFLAPKGSSSNIILGEFYIAHQFNQENIFGFYVCSTYFKLAIFTAINNRQHHESTMCELAGKLNRVGVVK